MFYKRLKSEWRKLKIAFYQKVADQLVLMLMTTTGSSDVTFEYIYNIAMKFNEYCIEKDIYLN